MSQIREVSGGSGYLSQNSLTVEFGLGAAALVDTLEVRWPSGLIELLSASVAQTTSITSVPVDQRIIIVEGFGIVTGIDDEDEPVLPKRFALYQNVPNPFNPTTVIHYSVAAGGHDVVTLRIYDVSGRLVRTLVNGHQTPGEKRVVWDGTNGRGQGVATGVYFYRLTAPGFVKTRKMVLLK